MVPIRSPPINPRNRKGRFGGARMQGHVARIRHVIMKTLGYLRVSTQEQRTDRQIDALETLCDRLFIESASAIAPRRPVFDTVMGELVSGDALVILDLDRAFRSVIDALQVVGDLQARQIDLRIVNLQVDTATPGGMLVYTVLCAFAEFERRLLSQRTKEGLAAARKRGKRLGRPPKLSDRQLAEARQHLERRTATLTAVAQSYNVAPWSLRRALNRTRPCQTAPAD